LKSSSSRGTCRCRSARPNRIPRHLLCSHYIDLSMTSYLFWVVVRLRRLPITLLELSGIFGAAWRLIMRLTLMIPPRIGMVGPWAFRQSSGLDASSTITHKRMGLPRPAQP
jgi:hypothetical protein